MAYPVQGTTPWDVALKTYLDATYAQTANNLSDVTAATARTNLGLGTAALAAVDLTATDIVALGTQAAGATGKVADAGHVHPSTGVFLSATSLGGDLSGTLPNPSVVKVNGTALSGLTTGLLKNTTGTGVPSIAVAGTDYLAGTTSPIPAIVVKASNSVWAGTGAYACSGANDEVKINAAIVAAAAVGGQVILSDGLFVIANPILMYTGVKISGQGRGTSVKIAAAFPNSRGAVELNDVNVHGHELCDLYLDGRGQLGTNIAGVWWNNVAGVFSATPYMVPDPEGRIHDVHIYNFSGIGFVSNVAVDGSNAGTSNTRATRMAHVKIVNSGTYGVYYSSSDSTFLSVITAGSGLDGFYDTGANNMYANCKSGFNNRDGYRVAASRNTYVGCQAQDNGVHGFDVTSGSNAFSSCIADSNGRLRAGGVGDGFFMAANNCSYTGILAVDRGNTASPNNQRYGYNFSSGTNNFFSGKAVIANMVGSRTGTTSTFGVVNLQTDEAGQSTNDASNITGTFLLPSPQPTDHGFLSWSFDPSGATTNAAIATAGTLNLVKIWIPAGTVTNVHFFITSAGVTLTSGQNFAGLFNAAGTLLSATADQSAAWTVTALKTMALTTPQTFTAGAYFFVGFFYNGTTAPSLNRASAGAVVNANLSAVNSRYGTGTAGQTTAMSGATGTIAALSSAWWVAVS